MSIDRLTIELETLKRYKHRLTKQEYLTFKGQIYKHDYEGFRKGLWKLMMKKIGDGTI